MRQKLTYFYSLLLTALFLLPWSGMKADQLNEGFEGADFVPEGWSAIHVSGSATWVKYAGSYSNYGHDSKTCAKVSWGPADNYLITPQLRPASGEKLSFYAASTSYGGSTLEILVSTTDNSSASSFSSMSPAKSYASNSSDIPSGSWNKIEIDLSSYVDQDIYVAFRVTDNDGDAVYIDDVSGVTLKPESCPKTGTPEASNVGAKTATISWTAGGTEGTWNLQYKKTSASEWTTVSGLTSTTYELTGLEAGKVSYDYQVQADCGGGETSGWKAGTSFQTECDTKELGWKEEFSSSLSSCWNTANRSSSWSSSYVWSPYGYTAYSGSYSLRLYSNKYSSTYYSELETPPTYISDKAILAFYRIFGMTVEVYAKEGDTRTLLTTLSTNTSWKADTINIPETYVTKNVSFIFKGYGGGSSNKYAYLDDVSVIYAPVAKPTSLAAGPTADGAVVTWESAEGTSWNLRYREYNAEPEADWIEVNGLTAKTHTLTGLSDTKTYEVQVMTVCSANRQSDWTASATFSPESCPTVTAVTFGAQTYNSVVVNWTATSNSTWALRYKAAGDADYTVASSTISELTYNLTGLTTNVAYTVEVKPAACGDWVAAATTYTPVYPAMGTVTVGSIAEMTASATWADVTGATGYEYVIMEGETAADWTGPTAATSPATLSELAAGTNYTVYVRAKFGEGRGAEASKNFTTSTVAPTALTQGATTTNSIAFSWSYAGAASQFQWKSSKEGSVWSDPISVLTATETGLAAGTTYTFYVRAYYSATVQSAELTGSFDTECGTASLPFSQDFGNSGTTKPNCWTIANWGTSGNNWTKASDYAKTGVALRYNAKTYSSSDAITPSITIDDKAELKFYIKNSVGNNSAKVECRVLVNDGETTTEIAHITTRYTSATQLTYDLSAYKGKTVTIIFRGIGYDSSTTSYLWIDDVTITYKPIDAPTDLTAEAGDASATISWTDDAEAGPWDIQYRAYKAEEPYESWSTPISSASKSYNLIGLTNGTEYEVQVRTHCSENRISAWTASQTFTPVACATVSEVTFGAATYNSVVVNWTANANSTWELQYKAGEGDWTTASNAVNALTYTLEGLTTGTAYSVRVKATCADELAWVEAESAFTPAYSAPANAAVADATDAAASASWDAVADAPNGYKYAVVAAGETPNWDEATATDELTASLTGLAGLSDYDFYVAAVYGDHVEAAAAVNFQTIAVAPTALTQGTTTVNSIAFSWSYAGAATKFQWKSSKEGSDWSEPISATNAEETGLTAGTSYTMYVRAYYADGKYSSELSETFGTECAVLALPFSQDFEDGVSPLCWSAATAYSDYYDYDGNYGWKVKEDNDGNYVMRYKSGTALTTPALTLPQIDLTATPAVLSFKVLNNYSNKTVNGNVTISAEGVDDLVTSLTTSSSLAEQRVDLSSFAGKRITVKFQATSNTNGGRIDLDDIRILEQLNLADNVDNTETLNNYLGKSVDVTIGRTFVCADYYNTICLPFDLSAEQLAASPIASNDLWAFKYARVEGGELLIRIQEADHINAGEPYLIAWPAGDPIENPLFKNVTISASAGKSMGEDALKFVGTLKPEAFPAGDDSKLFLYQNNTLYWWDGDQASSLKSFRAFFTVEGGAGTSTIKHLPARIVKHDQTATDVENIFGNGVESIKLLENNQVVIIRNGVKYNVQGLKIQ